MFSKVRENWKKEKLIFNKWKKKDEERKNDESEKEQKKQKMMEK